MSLDTPLTETNKFSAHYYSKVEQASPKIYTFKVHLISFILLFAMLFEITLTPAKL